MDLPGFFNDVGLLAALCFIFGLLLVALEIFAPGFGIPGIAGTFLLMIGVIVTARNVAEGLVLILILLVIIGIILMLVLRSATRGKLGKSVILNESLNKEGGFSGTNEDWNRFLGREGVAVTTLRPSGTAEFDGIKLDVVSEGEFIRQGASVRVLKVEGRRIVVREIELC